MKLKRHGHMIAALLLVAVMVTAAAFAADRPDRPHWNGSPDGGLRPDPGLTVYALRLAQSYHLVLLVLWLAGASFAAGVVVGLVLPRRGSLWATVIAAGFIAMVVAAGGEPVPPAQYRNLLAAGGLLILVSAAIGGTIGQHLWLAVKQPAAGRGESDDQRGEGGS